MTLNNNHNRSSSNVSRSSTKTKGTYQVKRKQIKNKRATKRKHSLCIIV